MKDTFRDGLDSTDKYRKDWAGYVERQDKYRDRLSRVRRETDWTE